MRATHFTIDRKPTSKYGSVRTRGFASKREAERALELHLAERAGAIRNLRCQVKVELIPRTLDGYAAIHYIVDFVYEEAPSWEEVWEDCKGVRTQLYKMKRALVLWRFGKRIRET